MIVPSRRRFCTAIVSQDATILNPFTIVTAATLSRQISCLDITTVRTGSYENVLGLLLWGAVGGVRNLFGVFCEFAQRNEESPSSDLPRKDRHAEHLFDLLGG